MEAQTATTRGSLSGVPPWLLGVLPLALIALAIAAFAVLGGPGLGERSALPIEELAVERTALRPGEIELTVRNDGPDSVAVAQVIVNDAFVPFSSSEERVGRLEAATLSLPYEWIEGQAYEVAIVTSTGATIAHAIPVAAETPQADADFYGLMALLGVYVGVIPVTLGMLWLPFVRRIGAAALRVVMAFTVGLLAFLAIDATLEGLDVGAAAPSAFGGIELVFLGAIASYLALTGVESYLRSRRAASQRAGADGGQLSLLIAAGIGLHNLGEGLAIGSAYALGSLALGAFLVIGFALHNTTEGLAIVAPLARSRPGLGRLIGLGLLAGAPAILGAWIGAAALNPSLGALLFGLGVGAIAQVIQQLAPSLRDRAGNVFSPATVAGLLGGVAVLYFTGLLVSV